MACILFIQLPCIVLSIRSLHVALGGKGGNGTHQFLLAPSAHNVGKHGHEDRHENSCHKIYFHSQLQFLCFIMDVPIRVVGTGLHDEFQAAPILVIPGEPCLSQSLYISHSTLF